MTEDGQSGRLETIQEPDGDIGDGLPVDKIRRAVLT